MPIRCPLPEQVDGSSAGGSRGNSLIFTNWKNGRGRSRVRRLNPATTSLQLGEGSMVDVPLIYSDNYKAPRILRTLADGKLAIGLPLVRPVRDAPRPPQIRQFALVPFHFRSSSTDSNKSAHPLIWIASAALRQRRGGIWERITRRLLTKCDEIRNPCVDQLSPRYTDFPRATGCFS